MTTHAHRTSVDARTYRQKAFVRQSRIHASSTESSNQSSSTSSTFSSVVVASSSHRDRVQRIHISYLIRRSRRHHRHPDRRTTNDASANAALTDSHRIARHSRHHGVANAGRLSRRRTRQGTHARIDDTTRIRYARDRSATERNGTSELTHLIFGFSSTLIARGLPRATRRGRR